jgi:hypothetical protein
MLRDVQKNFMDPRPGWNAIGPYVPAWFRRRLKRIDPKLVLQFFPPTWLDKRGVFSDSFPLGTWVVCRKMKRTGWLLLHKNWVWQLCGQSLTDGKWYPRTPTMEDVRLLMLARDLYRRGRTDELENRLDHAFADAATTSSVASRGNLVAHIEDLMRKMGVAPAQGSRIVVPSLVA